VCYVLVACHFTYICRLDQSPRSLRPAVVWSFEAKCMCIFGPVIARWAIIGSEAEAFGYAPKALFRQHSVYGCSHECPPRAGKMLVLACPYWRMLPNSRITAHICILIGQIMLQNGGPAMTRKGSCSCFTWPWADLQIVTVLCLGHSFGIVRQL
jgi:hypothetical protein